MVFLVFGFLHGVWMRLADDVSELVVCETIVIYSYFTRRVKSEQNKISETS